MKRKKKTLINEDQQNGSVDKKLKKQTRKC